MKTRALFVFSCTIFAFLIFNFSFCFGQWQWQNPLPQGNTLNDVFFIDQHTGWAVGDAGTIMKSTNGGLTFELINFPTHKNLASVEFFDPITGLITGESGIILKTIDGGLSWNQVETGLSANYTDMCIINSSNAWLSCDDGTILKSIDYGDTWQVAFSDTSMQFNSISFVDENHGWATGAFDTYDASLVRTSDGGNTWTSHEPPFDYPVLDICFTDTLTGYASSSIDDPYFLVKKTTDGGESWQIIGDEVYYGEFYDIMFTDPDHGWIAGSSATVPGSYGILYFTDDGGMTWYPGENSNYEYQGDFNAVYFINSDKGWMVGSSGNALYSIDGGVHWTNVKTGSNGSCILEDVFFTDDQNGWVVGASFYTFESKIFHTSDEGNSWHAQPPLDHMLNSIYFVDPLEGWIVGGRSLQANTTAIYHTSNGGNQWEIQFSENLNNGDFSDIYFKDAEYGWAVGDGGNQYPPENISLFYYTEDGGENWINHSFDIHHALSSICFVDDETGYISGHKTILRTIDGGQSWTEIWTGPHYLKDIFFTDSNHGWALGDSATRYPYRDVIMRTTDGGITWEEQFPGVGSWKKQIFFTDSDHGWIARDEGDILYTVNGGVTWLHMFLNFNYYLGGVFFTDIDHGWIVGADEAIFHINNGSIVGVKEKQPEIQISKFKVQSYPNPTKDIFNLQFTVCNLQKVRIEIFDLYGRQVAVILDEQLPAGEQVVSWNAEGLPAGIYLYQLSILQPSPSGQANDLRLLTETGKIVLMR